MAKSKEELGLIGCRIAVFFNLVLRVDKLFDRVSVSCWFDKELGCAVASFQTSGTPAEFRYNVTDESWEVVPPEALANAETAAELWGAMSVFTDEMAGTAMEDDQVASTEALDLAVGKYYQ